jgi:NAD(P)-dependent dehydrogenase (short-subunit alcohol dehydrogenase family)
MQKPSQSPIRSALELFKLDGRVALVTGGAGLLGAQFCRSLAQAGAAVMVADIDAPAAEELAQVLGALGYQASAVAVDITDPASVQRMVQFALKAYRRLDILVNSAALDPKFDPQHQSAALHEAGTGAFEDFPLEVWNQALAVNLTGAYLCCQAAVQPMLAQGSGYTSVAGMLCPCNINRSIIPSPRPVSWD